MSTHYLPKLQPRMPVLRYEIFMHLIENQSLYYDVDVYEGTRKVGIEKFSAAQFRDLRPENAREIIRYAEAYLLSKKDDS